MKKKRIIIIAIILLLICILASSSFFIFVIKNKNDDSFSNKLDSLIYKIVHFVGSINDDISIDPYRNYDPVGEREPYVFIGTKQCAWRGVTYSINPNKGYKDRYAPENSMPAYRRAVEEDFDYLWLASIRFSTDNDFFIIHDSNVERVSAVNQEVATSSSEQLRSLRLSQKGWIEWPDDELKIPELEQVLSFAQENNQPVGIRLGVLPPDRNSSENRAIWEKFIGICQKYEICKESIFSGSLAQISIVNYYEPSWHVQTICSSSSTKDEKLKTIEELNEKKFYRCSLIVYSSDLDQEVIDVAHNYGIYIFGVSDEPIIKDETLDLFTKLKIDAIITHCKIFFE